LCVVFLEHTAVLWRLGCAGLLASPLAVHNVLHGLAGQSTEAVQRTAGCDLWRALLPLHLSCRLRLQPNTAW